MDQTPKPFFVWRLQRFAKIAEVELPWPYDFTDDDNARPWSAIENTISALGGQVPDALVAALTPPGISVNTDSTQWPESRAHGFYFAGVNLDDGSPINQGHGYLTTRLRPIGHMFVCESSFAFARRQDFLITPPVYMFADLKNEFPGRDFGSRKFWVAPSIYEKYGQLLQGDDGKQWFDVDAMVATDYRDVMDHVMIALDSFLSKRTPDTRFGGAVHATRKPRKRR